VLADESFQLLSLHVQATTLDLDAVELLALVLLQVSLAEDDWSGVVGEDGETGSAHVVQRAVGFSARVGRKVCFHLRHAAMVLRLLPLVLGTVGEGTVLRVCIRHRHIVSVKVTSRRGQHCVCGWHCNHTVGESVQGADAVGDHVQATKTDGLKRGDRGPETKLAVLIVDEL
jgi:hypothetical protein